MRRIIFSLGLIFILGCSNSNNNSPEINKTLSKLNFNGAWKGEGEVFSPKLGTKPCPAIILDLNQNVTQLTVNVIKWTCGNITKSTNKTIVLDINNGNLLYQGKKVGEISDEKITAEMHSSSTSKYEIIFDEVNDLILYKEIIDFNGQDEWSIFGNLRKFL